MQKRFLSILLIVSLVISLAVPLVAADPGDSNPQLNEEQLQAYNEILAMGELSGLYGFVEADISLDNEDMVPVIVMFKHNPAEVEQALQQAAGYQPVQPAFFPFNPAPSLQELADNDKTIFYDSLDNIFTKPAPQTPFVPAIAPLTSPDYYITLDYDTAINGLAMTLPANKVAELLSIDSVAAVFYDETVYVDGWVDDDDLVGEAFAVASNKVSSMAMEIQLAHAQGVKGKGVKVAVVDTGVDYNHPDLKGAFQSWDNMEDVPELYKERVHYRAEDNKYVYYGVNAYDMQFYPFTNAPHPYPNIARVIQSGIPGKAANPALAKWDPLEITHHDWRQGYTSITDFMNNHGTHVSGIIAARGVFASDLGVVGVAPECDLVVYRIGGPGGTGNSAATIKSLEMGVEEGVKIFNYSFGSAGYPGTYGALAIAINYATLAYDIIFCKSAGNSGSGPRLITGPGGSSLALVSGNATYAADNVDFRVGNSIFTSKLSYTDRSSEFTPILDSNNKLKEYVLEGRFGGPNTDNSHNFFILPQRSGGGGANGIGAGAAADYTALTADQLAQVRGSIVVIARGADSTAIATVIANAVNRGALGLVIINPQSGGSAIITSWAVANGQMVATYIPTMVMTYANGIAFANALTVNAGNGFINEVHGRGTFGLSTSSSRGPVADSYEIKPDITTPGTSIWSTVPWYNSLSSSSATPAINDTTYRSRGYASMTGTSMASPFSAGLCALVWSYDLILHGEYTMKATEVRARLANTADRLNFSSQSFGVNELGTGAPHINKALNVTSYVTVDKQVPVVRDGRYQDTVFEWTTAEVSSFSFLASYRGAEAHTRELSGNIYNVSAAAKTFAVSYVMQTAGTSSHNIRSNGKIVPTLPANTLTVPAGTSLNPGKVSFDLSLYVPAGLVANDVGSHEGFILVTNVDDPTEVYRLPWSIYIETTVPAWYQAGLDSEDQVYTIRTYNEWLQLIDIVRGGGGGPAGSSGGLGFRDQFAGKTVQLGANISINLTTTRFYVGTYEWPFKGTFDGNGFTLAYTISSPANPPDALSTSYRALFGHVQDAVIKNVTVLRGSGTTANGTIITSNRSAAIVGMASATEGNETIIANCVNNAIVQGGSSQIGGIVGFAKAEDGAKVTIMDCLNNGSVTGTTNVGGILGGTMALLPYIDEEPSGEIVIINCVNNGRITHTLDYGYSGGIAGSFTGSQVEIINCVNNGVITTGAVASPMVPGVTASLNNIHNAVGGIAGYVLNANIVDCVNTAILTNTQLLKNDIFEAQQRTGGIVAYGVNSNLSNNVNFGAINASMTAAFDGLVIAGGIAAVLEDSIAANNLNMGNIISKDIAAGTIAFGYGEGPNFVYRMSMLNGERAGTLDLADCLAVSSAKAIIGFPVVAEILHADLRQVFFFSPNYEDLLYVQTLLARDALDLDLLAEGCTLSRFVCWLDEDGEVFTGMMDPILNNTCLQALQVLEVVPVAFVEKVPGNKNILTIIIFETYSNGHAYEKTAEFVIDNNAADYYLVPTENEYQQYVYKVYVDTKGNTQIRDCYIVN